MLSTLMNEYFSFCVKHLLLVIIIDIDIMNFFIYKMNYNKYRWEKSKEIRNFKQKIKCNTSQ